MHIGRIIYILTTADILLVSASNLIMPLFAVFVTRDVVGAGVETVGFFTAIYWVSKSIFQIPVAWYLDRTKGESDEFYAMIAGYLMTSGIAFAYLAVGTVWHLYALAAVVGLADALGVPSYLSIFSRHLDHAKENIEWTLRSVGVGFAAAGTGALAGILVQHFGFHVVFIAGGILSALAAMNLIFIKPYLKSADGKLPAFPQSIGRRGA